MKRRTLTTLIACLLSSLLGNGTAQALVIRHDTATLDYENYGKWERFNASTAISRGDDYEYGIAGATAIDSRWGVHARHTLKDVDDYMDQGKTANLRGTKWNGWNYQGLANVQVNQVIYFDDDFTRFGNAIDIAVVQTKAASSTLRIAPLSAAWDEVGRVGSGVSAANNREDGNGNSRKTEAENTSNSGRWYEVRWAGKNDIDQVNGQAYGSPNNALLKCDFDHPTDTSKSVMGGNTAIDLEYGGMNGDSGSPIYIDKNGVNGQVAGVFSGGSGSEYGSTLIYVRIRPYRTWITDTILANPDSRAVYIATIPDQILDFGETLSVTESSTGTEQGPLTPSFSLVNPPTGMSIDSDTGEITWTPAADQAGAVYTITARVTEDGVVANSKDKSFQVIVKGTNTVDFWSWSAAPPNWRAVTISGGAPYRLGSAYPYLQGGPSNMIYQQVSGRIPAASTVIVEMKAADYHQSWSNGGELEYGFRVSRPAVTNVSDSFLYSSLAAVPDYNGVELVDGLTNTSGNVEYFFSVTTTTALTNPWFVVRKNEDGDRFAVDGIAVNVYFDDADGDGLSDQEEPGLGTESDDPDSDDDGLLDGVEYSHGTSPTDADSDDDGYLDGAEVASGSDPTDPESVPPFLAGYTEAGGDWMTKGSNDIDGSGGLGSDGYLFAGEETSPGVFNGVAENSTTFDGVGSLPAYITALTGGSNAVRTARGYSHYGTIDDPLLLDGTDAAGGFWLATAGVAGSALEIVNFSVSGLLTRQTVRVGVLGGVEGNADGRWDPTSITLSDGTNVTVAGDHGLQPLPADPGGTNAGWVFFDIAADGDYTVSVTKRHDSQGGTGIGGLTFDSYAGIEPGIASATNGSDLELTWVGRMGKVYDILRTTDLATPPAAWEMWKAGLSADPSGINAQTLVSTDGPRYFFRVVERSAQP